MLMSPRSLSLISILIYLRITKIKTLNLRKKFNIHKKHIDLYLNIKTLELNFKWYKHWVKNVTLCSNMNRNTVALKFQLNAELALSRFSCVWLFVTPWSIGCQALLSMGFSRQEYWSGLPCPPPGDFPDQGSNWSLLLSPELAGKFSTISSTWQAQYNATGL